MAEPSFPIPSTLQDLEREPYNLDPYPDEFQHDCPSESFEALVQLVEGGNRYLVQDDCLIISEDDDDSDEDDDQETIVLLSLDDNDNGENNNDKEEDKPIQPFIEPERLQALYTLVRKSTSLEPSTREALVAALCQAIRSLCSHLERSKETVSQSFRDTFACHLYMLYSVMVLMESSVFSQNFTNNNEDENNKDSSSMMQQRKRCVDTMIQAASAMAECRANLWQRGVPDESVVLLPCRIAYQLLEKSKGVVAKKAACGDDALRLLAITLESTESTFTTITAAVMDLMHSFEHMAALACELCSSSSNSKSDRLAIELLREVARVGASASSSSSESSKASGIAFVAPFLHYLAAARPKLVLQHVSHILPLLQQSECYQLRSAIVQALTHILEFLGKQQQQQQNQVTADNQDEDSTTTAITTSALDTTKSRDALLDLLAERAYDVSSFTRAATLKAWIALVNSSTLPKDRLLATTQLAMDRLQDKTVVVRKQAMQLLTTLLENHPFLDSLDPKPYREKLSELYEWIKANLPDNIRQAQKDDLPEGDDDNEETRLELEQAALAAAIDQADTMMAEQGLEQLSKAEQEYCSKVQALKFTQSALEFIEVLEHATVALESMLLSSNTSDVVEALRFFVQARHFQLPCAVTGMKRALALLWSTEQAIRDEVLKSFIDVFVALPGANGQELLPDNQITKNLLILTGQATVSELASIEEAVQRLVHQEVIPPNVFLMLWSIATKGSADARAAALRLLSMGASADRSIVDSKSRLKLLLEAGLGDYSRQRRDWRLAEAAAIALQRIERARVDPTDAKYLVQERILDQLQAVARGDWCNDTEDDSFQWFPASEQAIKAIFAVSPEPERVSRDVILQMYKKTFQDPESVNPLHLARFFHVIGQVSLQLLVYTEALCGSVRRANAKKTSKCQEEADKAKTRKRGTSEEGEEDNAIEAELGIAAEVEAENEREMSEIAEKEIVGRGLIGKFGPLLARVVANEDQRFGNVQILNQAAMLALVKLMCVSSSFCEEHLGLLFTALGNAPLEDTTMRANTVVALGDLAFRFPNEVEPYTPRLYACLRDASTKVRRHTLMVLTHLILNDMIRVKGQVCEIALCLRDDDPRIRDMSRLLFHELSKRTNNPIYNLLPDIISNLGQLDAIKKEDFRSIMSFLLGYIKKDRQNEMLVDKLCHRFPTSSSISQKANLAYCIAQLKMSDKAIKFLNENFKLYKDALCDEEIAKSFLSIVSKAKKKSNSDSRQLLEDWEAKINEAVAVALENESAGEKAARASKKAGRKKKGKPAKTTVQTIVEVEDEDLCCDDASATPEKKKAPKRATRQRRKVKRIVDDESQDDDASPGDLSFDGVSGTPEKEKAPKRSTRQKRQVKRIVGDSDDESQDGNASAGDLRFDAVSGTPKKKKAPNRSTRQKRQVKRIVDDSDDESQDGNPGADTVNKENTPKRSARKKKSSKRQPQRLLISS